MKNKLLLLLLFISSITYAQIPSYYNDVNLSLTGTDLKDELAIKIIGTHTNFLSYTPGVWNALEEADADPNNPNDVLLIYGYNDNDGEAKTDRTRGKFDHGGNLGEWNREHTYPKSLGTPNLGTTGPGSDAHHLRACDGQMNSTRNNRKYADGSGNAGITAQGYFYPGDEWKGDVARMMLFMYLRYDDRCLPVNVGIGNTIAGDNNMIDLFLQWNVEDPVNVFEDNRNEVIAGIQGNRNPFIDNPAFATQIWGGPQAEDRFGIGGSDTQAPSVPENLVASGITSSATTLSWAASTDNVGVTGYNVYQNGMFLTVVSTTNYNVSGLTQDTMYDFSVSALDQAGNESVVSTIVTIVTNASGTGSAATDLFISEYIEGSSNNKALEIANFTGTPIDLSNYTLKKATNGSGSFTSTVSLSGTLANGDVFVIAHSSATAVILNSADATNAGVMSFNGNDAIGLFKNNVLIDLLGDANSSANYAQNVTLQRKSNIVSPNTNYTITEWDSLTTDTFDNLGTHTIDGGAPPLDTEAPTKPTNVIASNVTETSVDLSWTASTDNTGVTAYDVFLDTVLVASVTSTNYSVSGLAPSSSYVLEISAKDAAGNTSMLSNPLTILTNTPPDTEAPSIPSNLAASNITQTSVDLTWVASSDNMGVTGYNVIQDGVLIATISTTSYIVNNLNADTVYDFTVTAYDSAGNTSVESNPLTILTESVPVTGTTLLSESYFESGWDNWSDGGGDCARYSGSRSFEGNYSIRLRDNSGARSAMTSQSYDVSSYDSVEISFYFYSYSMENNEDFWLRYNDGNSWTTVAAYASGTDFQNNNFYQATVSLDANSYNFTSNARFRFQADASSNADQIYIDQVVISGVSNNATRSSESIDANAVTYISHLNTESLELFEDDFKLYPNPVSGNVITIQFSDQYFGDISYRIISVLGQVVAKGNLTKNQINVNQLDSGMYILEINDGEEIMTKKFIKK
ncbi:endonuclease [Olleya sp. YS]|uniref:endonuclease n=1 Tax=Olleya sp. YS TaxID=3028318 RepID=UPI00243445AB|nr:endonuclease [Olleya sp. YS]WGD34195.1 endonuclease [Olleya sp. YS]